MKVIFLALAFPKMDRSMYLYPQLVSQFNENGHDITVVAPIYDDIEAGLQIESGIKVLRVRTLPLFGVGLIKKGIANLMLPYQLKKALKNHKIDLNFDLIITPTPPITLYGLAGWLKKKSRGKIYLILRDIFPQNAVDLGMMKKSGLIHSYFRRKEKKLYQKSDHIGCMSQGNIDFIKEHNPEVQLSKLHLLPNWGDQLPLVPETEIIELRKKEKLENKIVAIFGGNIGLPQKLENIVELAIACKNEKDLVFIIMGNGNEYDNLKKLIQSKNVENIWLRDSLPHKEYFKWVQMADIGIISLSEKFTIPNIPSKSLSYYNTKTPILASVDKNTDFGAILESNEVGVWAEAGDTDALKNKLLKLVHNKDFRKKLGENGFNYMNKELTSLNTYLTIINEIEKT